MVLLDEPTAALGIVQTAQILKLIERLRERGLGVIVISHNLADVFEVADRIAVLRLGRLAATSRSAKSSHEEIVAAITGADVRRASDGGDATVSAESETRPAEGRSGPRRPTRARASRCRRASQRLARGELASVRVLLGIAVIWTIFQIANDRFLTAVNLSNLTLQIAAMATISIGVVLVLLLGEIDLSVGAVSGLAAGVMAVLSVKHGWAPVLGDRRRARGRASRSGSFNGFIVTRFGMPSFVVTLAGLLGWQGALLMGAGRHRLGQPAAQHHHRPDERPSSTRRSAGSSGLAAIVAYAASRLAVRRRRARGGPRGSAHRRALALQLGLVAAAVIAAVAILNADRGVPLAARDRRRADDPVHLHHRAHALRPPHLRRRRQRGGGAAGRDPRQADQGQRLHARLDARRRGRHPRRLAPAGGQPAVGHPATCCCSRSPAR